MEKGSESPKLSMYLEEGDGEAEKLYMAMVGDGTIFTELVKLGITMEDKEEDALEKC